MNRYKLIVAYDGSNYHGWQVQPNGVTIEEVLNNKLTQLMHQPITVKGASRTDSGVHARGNVCIFDAVTTIPASRISYALQALLPPDIVIVKSEQVDVNWHPRYQTSIKTYEYRIQLGETYDPTLRHTHLHIRYPLMIEQMKEACTAFIGSHDYAPFCNVKSSAKTTIREITEAELYQVGRFLIFRVSGYGFLYNMVRMMVGSLLLIGRGNMSHEDLTKILQGDPFSLSDTKHRVVAAAHGLILDQIEFI